MTVAPAASTSGPVAPPAVRAASDPPADHFAFAAMLDSLPSGAGKAGDDAAKDEPCPPNESQRGKSFGERTARHALANENALLASLPFALRAASLGDERPQAAGHSPSFALAAAKAPESEVGGPSGAADAKPGKVGRLTGERAFHVGAPPASLIKRGSLSSDAPFAPAAGADPSAEADASGEGALAPSLQSAGSLSAQPLADIVASSEGERAQAPSLARAGSAAANRVGPRAAPHEAARSGRNPEVLAPPPVTRAASPTQAAAPAGSSGDGKRREDHGPDPTDAAAQAGAPTGAFDTLQPTAFGAGPSFEADASRAEGGALATAPRESAAAASPASGGQPVREIDVDLSLGGLEDVSMTMRLAGEKLSVVVRASSSHTLNSIEGARDAIADRLAAIGQPLDSLIVKQTGLNTDGNTNANIGQAKDGSAGKDGRYAHSQGERGGSNDALSRRGAGRDRGF
ncbi:MAG TPA: flagellar hook-length control protein FliK [Roseiarcus sp.]|nr:flagellar hook-length control protein FliK [Roseiarcus sp.]